MSYNLNVTREGNKLTLTTDEGEVEYEWTVNEQGYVIENGDYSYEYDEDGPETSFIDFYCEKKSNKRVCNGNKYDSYVSIMSTLSSVV